MCEVPPEALNSLLDRIVNCFSTVGLSQRDLVLVTVVRKLSGLNQWKIVMKRESHGHLMEK